MNLVLPRKAQITDVRSGICQLRDKLRPLGQEQHIVSVFGYGYRWDPGPLQD
jgi:DNA-binding response OmpR family regulator